MKIKKIAVVIVFTISLLGMQIRGAYGIQEVSAQDSELILEPEEFDMLDDTNEIDNIDIIDIETAGNVEDVANIEDMANMADAADVKDADDMADVGNIEDADNVEDTNSVEDANDVEDTNDVEDANEVTGITDDTDSESEDISERLTDVVNTDSIPKIESRPMVMGTGSNSQYYDNHIKASGTFIDNRDKVKYNVALPIEGIPSFITQEMIIGALKCQDEKGYPASVTIAQIIQESGFGSYGPEGEQGLGLSYLAYQYNNLFGIKGTGPAGTVNMRTGEETVDGTSYMTTAGFRVYNTYTECIMDRAELLERVYGDLIEDVTDANTFAVKIGRRWATDHQYAENLVRQMEYYDLYRLDEMTVGEFSEMIGIFANPCPGAVLTSSYGLREAPIAGASTYHKGIDLGTGEFNLPTYAADAGVVTFAGECGDAGNMIVIDHENGVVTKYMHHDKIYVEVGQEVEKGQQIGLSGNTGNSTGNHLHFQVEENGVAVDPEPYLGLLLDIGR